MNGSPVGTCPTAAELRQFVLGLAEDARGEEIGRHLASCPECTIRVAALREELALIDFTELAGHPEAALLARWSRDSSAVSKVEAGEIRAHLAGCDSCREGVARLERISTLAESLERAGERSMARLAVGPERPADRPRRSWILPAYSALATAAAVALALRGTTVEPPAPAGGSSPTPAPVPAPGTPAPTPAPAPAPVEPPAVSPTPSAPAYGIGLLPKEDAMLYGQMRGAVDASGIRSISPSVEGGILVVRVEPMFDQADDDDPIDIELRRVPGERLLDSFTVPWKALYGGPRIALTRGGDALPKGSYLLRLRHRAREDVLGAAVDSIDYRFDVK